MRSRSERGAVAIIYALVAVMLMGTAALSVDIGNGISRKSDAQGQADFAALAAGQQLGTQTSGTVPSNIVDAVVAQLNANRPINGGACRAQTQCVTAAGLTDGSLANGEVRFCSGMNAPAVGCRRAGLQVVGPQAKVDFGFASVFGVNAIQVQGTATVHAYSPAGTLPLYAVSGCDYGRQTLTDPANGQGTPLTVPPLTTTGYPVDNGATLTSITPSQVPLNPVTPPLVTIVGSHFDKISAVGFFRPASEGGAVVTVPVVPPVDTAGSATGSITVAVPPSVTSVETVWWVRVQSDPLLAGNSHQGNWSPADTTGSVAFRVGASVLECGAGSSDGNFGSLSLNRTDVSSINDQLAMNIINLQPPTSLQANTDPGVTPTNATCSDGSTSPNGTVAVVTGLPNPGQKPHTNCVSTDTGLPAAAATAGFITGMGATQGRLRNKATTCGPVGARTTSASVTLQSTTYTINNDVLSCFLTGSHNLQEVSSASYSGNEAFDSAIFESPRFFFVPVVEAVPTSGGSADYWIVSFRPAFLTDETVASTSTQSAGGGATSENGIHIEQNQIKSIKVIFFNINALPNHSDGVVQDFLGVGRPIVRLVD